ncbi:MAG: DUF192 domain-containing protein [Candidatus Omnitrophica bacterium]|nr:DUF192 domain-containing protein [Candidatus Omnitrophota bacterium]
MLKKRIVYNLFNKSKNCLIASKVSIANNFFLRLKGLMFRESIDKEEALVFYHTPSIHTFFMRFPIEVVFLNQKMQVKEIYQELKPKRVVFSTFSFIAIELPAFKTSNKTLEIGDILELTPSEL